MRVGFGYDVHAFSSEPDRPLVLGGVRFQARDGLAGHSDADVVLHAISDAILGAFALGDIGEHFPPGDPAWLGADSGVLLARVQDMAPDGARIVNVDVTVIAERPKIGPRRRELRESIAGLLGIDVARVSVKATTNEGLGSLGRGEGIAAFAVVLMGEES